MVVNIYGRNYKTIFYWKIDIYYFIKYIIPEYLYYYIRDVPGSFNGKNVGTNIYCIVK